MLGLAIFIGLSSVLTSVHLTSVAEQTVHVVTRMTLTRDFRDVAETLESTRHHYFDVIRYSSPEPGRSLTLHELEETLPRQSWPIALTRGKVAFPIADFAGKGGGERLEFEFNRFAYGGYAILLWAILILVSVPQTRFMKRRLVAQFEREVRLQREVAQSEIAREVCHNIRTPLAALMRLGPILKGLSEDERKLFGSVVSQIQGIASTLAQTSASENGASNANIADVFQEAFAALPLAAPDRISIKSHVDDSSFSAISRFDPGVLKAILSNVISNSIDAISGTGWISAKLLDHGHEMVIEVVDSGVGIAVDIASRAMEKGFSFGKSGGSGFGLFHASTHIKSWGRHIAICSPAGQGATVTIRLPIAERESWYVPRIKLSNLDRALVIDDQDTAHELWAMTIKEAGFRGRVQYARSAEEAKPFLSVTEDVGKLHVFADFDLGLESLNGLELLRSAPTGAVRYLVTGHFDDASVRSACERDRILLLPKTSLPHIPFVVR